MSVPLPLHLRLEGAFEDFWEREIAGNAALEEARAVLVAGVVLRARDEDGVMTPRSAAPKKARLVVQGEDAGRVRPYVPIRNFRLKLSLRANGKTLNGSAEEINALYGALETLLDGSNLKEQLTSASRGIAVMKATRQPGVGHSANGDLRTEFYALELACVGLEHTNAARLEDGRFAELESRAIELNEG